jgi:hypothetical protein
MDVSIIIVSFNTKALIKECLLTIYSNTSGLHYEIIVVDNNSEDGSRDMIQNEFPQVILISNENNLGFGAACNIGINCSRGKYVFLLNSDTTLLNNSIKIFYDFMESQSNGNIWCCGGLLYDKDMNLQPAFGNLPSFPQIIIQQFGVIRFLRRYYESNLSIAVLQDLKTLTSVPFVCGADMFIRRSALIDHSMFDEEFFLYYEEVYLSYVMQKKGLISVIVPDAIIMHHVGRSFQKNSYFKEHHLLRSEFIYFRKVYGRLGEMLARAIHLVGALLRYLLRWDCDQLRAMKMIINP